MRLGLAVVGAWLVVCCGSGKPAVAPGGGAGSPPSSHLTFTTADKKVEATGHAFAMKGDGGTLAVTLFGSDTDPAPSCDNLKTMPPSLGSKGTMLMLGLTGMKDGPGKLDVVAYANISTDGAGAMSMGGGGGDAPTGSTMTITSVTNDSLDGTVDAGKGPASGEIHATICSGTASPIGAASGGAPAIPDVPPPPPPDSHVTLADAKNTVNIDGNGFARPGKGGTLEVMIVQDKKAPSCDSFTTDTGLMEGFNFSLKAEGFKGKPGKLKVVDHHYAAVGQGGDLDTVSADKTFGTVLTVTKADKASVDVTLAPRTKGMKEVHASGTIHAAMCPAAAK